MKKILLASVILSFGFLSQAYALNLSIGDAYYLGSINDGIPSSEAAEASYINYLITLPMGAPDTIIGTETYNRLNSSLAGPFPYATDAGAVKQDNSNTTFAATGFEYILGKYDASRAGSLVWYFAGGFTESVVMPSTYNGHGLSHTTGFNGSTTVPEPATMLLFGTGLIGIAGLRRKKS